AHGGGAGLELYVRRWIRVKKAFGETNGADVEAVVPTDTLRVRGDELRRPAAEIDDHRLVVHLAVARDAAVRQQRLVVAREKTRREAVAPLDLAEERLSIVGIADRTRRDRKRAFRAGLFDRPAKVREHVPHSRNRERQEFPASVDPFAEPGHACL